MTNQLEKLETPEQADVRKRSRKAILFSLSFAVAMLAACVVLKTCMARVAVESGLGNVTTAERIQFFSMLAVGFVAAAPAWGAMYLVLTPFSLSARLSGTLAWLAAILIALGVGQVVTFYARDTDMRLVSWEFLIALPMITVGWCAAFGLLTLLKRWHVRFPQFENTTRRQFVSIQSLLAATFVVAASVAALGTGKSLPLGIAAMVGAVGLGLLSLPMIFGVLRTKNYLALWFGIAILFFVASFVLSMFAGGSFMRVLARATGITAFVVTVCAPVVAVRICGAKLLK